MPHSPAKRPTPKRPKAFSLAETHQAMIQDRLRTLSYKKAIESNVKQNDTVLDIGCGTGILSFFAAKKGCKKVFAVDKSDIISSAIETAKLNNLEKCCEFFKGDIFKFKPRRKVDVLIHEHIGRFLWDESVVSKVARIRDNFLKKDGVIIPFKIELYLAPTSYRSDFEKSLLFWAKKQYGIDFSNLCRMFYLQRLHKWVSPQIIRLKDRRTFLCRPKPVHVIDPWKADRIPLKIAAAFSLKKGSRLSDMCAYFKGHLDKNIFFTPVPRLQVHIGDKYFHPAPKKNQ